MLCSDLLHPCRLLSAPDLPAPFYLVCVLDCIALIRGILDVHKGNNAVHMRWVPGVRLEKFDKMATQKILHRGDAEHSIPILQI